MKNLIKILFTLLTLSSFSQTRLDSLVFDEVNKYRDSLNLSKLEWDNASFKGSNIQSTYLQSTNGIVGHDNPNDSMKTHKDRYEVSGGKETQLLEEICNSPNKNFKINDNQIEEKLAIEIVSLWKKSPEHNGIMTEKRMKYAGCSIKIKTSSTGIKTYVHYDVISVMLLHE